MEQLLQIPPDRWLVLALSVILTVLTAAADRRAQG